MFSQNILIIWMVVLTTIIAFIFNSKYFSFLDRKDDFSNKEINGLRFFLSIGVAYHHFIFSYNYSTGKGWSIANYDIITFLGKFSVGIFFIISGYLFYNSVTSKTEWKSFFIKRFLRIVSMCTLSSIICLIIAVHKGWDNFSIGHEFYNILYWLDGGLTNYRPDVSSFVNAGLINAGVTWTLVWEWMFYFSLPLLSLFIKDGNRLTFVIALIAISYYILPKYDYNAATYAALFSSGFLAKELKTQWHNKIILNALPLALLTGMFLSGNLSFTLPMIPFMFIFFIISINKNSLFGILRSKGIVTLGEASYSIYLLHGIGWFIMNNTINTSNTNITIYLIISSVTLLITMIVSSLTYTFIEIPFMNLSKHINKNSLKSNSSLIKNEIPQ